MSPPNINGAEYLVGKIFSDEFFFKMPIYQRPYAWTTEEVSELLDDLLSFLGDDGQEVQDLSPYFLGSVVLIKGDGPEAEVVDGQQRLTTLTILLAVLRKLATPEFADGLTAYLYQRGSLVAGTPNRYRLTLRERDAGFLRNYVQDVDGLIALENQKETLRKTAADSQKNILENALYFLRQLQSMPEVRQERLARFIITRCFLVVVSTPDLESAYRIFSVLNDRGLPLTYPDILKAQILGNLPEGPRRSEYAQKWELEEEQLGRDPFQNLFSHIRMVYRKTKVRNVLTEFRDYIRPADNPEGFVDDTLLPFARAFGDVRNASYESTSNADQINAMLRWLSQIDNADWIPPAILYMKRYRDRPEQLLSFLRDLDRLAAGLMLLRVNINQRIERYGRLLTAIENEEDLYSLASPLQLTSEEKAAIVNVLDGDIYNFRQIRMLILLRLDSALTDGGVVYNHPVITVEHVLPQNPPEGSEWLMWFPDEEERANLTHRLGNLALLSRRKNAQAQNFSFDKKKRAYFQRNGVANFALTNQVLSREVWTPDLVERRQRELVAKLTEVWRL